MRRNMLMLCGLLFLVLCSFHLNAQVKIITGLITDSTGTPISGASIKIRGARTGSISTSSGAFSLKAEDGNILEISFVNYKTQYITIDDRIVYNIILKASNVDLNDVVVTAMGIKRNRNTLPYAAQQINGDEVSKQGVLNPVSALSGKVAGLQITQENTMGGSTNIILRGVKSLTQNNQALIVIDGVPYDNSNFSTSGYDLGNAAGDINGYDIESITALKGAAASALYGSRGANGVILITTKKGKKNAGLGVSVTFGMTAGTPDNSTLPKYQTEYGEGYDPDFSANTVPIFNSNGVAVPVVETYGDAAQGPKYDPGEMVYNWDAFMPGDPDYGKATPWEPAKHYKPQDYFVTPVTASEDIEVSQSSDKSSFRLGFRHDDNKNYMPNSNLLQNSLNFSTDYKLVKNVTVGGAITYDQNAAVNRDLYQYTGSTNAMTDFRQWWQTNVDIDKQKWDYFHAIPGQNWNATWNWNASAYMDNSLNGIDLPAYHDNLYWAAYQNYESDGRNRYFGNIHLNWDINPYLKFMARVADDYYDQLIERRANVGSVEQSFYWREDDSHDERNYDLLLNFNKDLSKDFNLAALLGENVREDIDKSITATTNGGLVVPGFYALSNSKNTPAAPSEYYGKKYVYGTFAGATLGYKEMLTLDGTIRRDESSTLPTNNNIYWYPSVSLNFQFSKLLNNLSWLTHAKAWINYAQVGNDAPLFSLYNTYASGTPFNGQTVFSTPGTNNNPNLKPETNKTYEFGLEASFLNDRIGFSSDYYKAKQENQIMPSTVSQATGYSYFYVNGGAIQNSGFEVTVNLNPVKTRNFSWNMDINWSNNKQKVLSLYNNQPSYVVGSYQNSIRLVAVPGLPYQLQGTDYVYNKNGQRVIDDNGYYEIAANNYTNLGSPFPDWRGGVNNSFRYKNFTLSFLVDVSQGGKVYSLDMDYGSSSGLLPRTAGMNDLGNPVRSPLADGGGIILKGVHEDGTPNTTRIDESNVDGKATNDPDKIAYTFSSLYGEAAGEFVYDASYVKLREVTLTYSLMQSALKHINFIKGIDFTLAGRNLWIIHKDLPYSDPEQGQASGNASMGFQNGAFPVFRNFGIIVKVNF